MRRQSLIFMPAFFLLGGHNARDASSTTTSHVNHPFYMGADGVCGVPLSSDTSTEEFHISAITAS